MWAYIVASMAAHQVLWTLGLYSVFSNAVGAMPTPSPESSNFYRWSFDFGHLMSSNISRIIATRYPQASTMVQTMKPTQDGEGVQVTTVKTKQGEL
jgi:hypothetical protein